MEEGMVCPQCFGDKFYDDGNSLACTICGLQIEKQRYDFEEEKRNALTTPMSSTMKALAQRRKKNFVEKGAKGRKRKEEKAADSFPEDWSDYLVAYQKILKYNCEAAKKHFDLRAPDQFEQELKKVWFGYLNKWKASGVRLQGGFMEARKGCFKMALPGKLSKRFVLNNEPTIALSEEAINLENSADYRKVFDEQYNTLKSEFYKEKASHRRSHSHP